MHVILKDRKVIVCGWLRHMLWLHSNPDRRVARDKVGDYEISTVFLGLPVRRFVSRGDPKNLADFDFFETLVQHPTDDELDERYSTWEEAEQGHARFVALCRTKAG